MNSFYKLIALGLFATVASTTISAQEEKHCGTTEATEQLRAKHPELQIAWENYQVQMSAAEKAKKGLKASTIVYLIPTVVHVIHQNGPENISDAQIQDEINILNTDFRKLNSDISAVVPGFDTVAADTYIEFRLAKLDPNGNCTNGIDRIYSHLTNYGDDAAKLNQWPRDKYFNVWTVKTMANPAAAGYSYYPSDVSGMGFPADGVIMLHSYIGSIGTSSVGNSRVLTHEISHAFNLEHTWGSTNNPGVACGDDGVDDTPLTKGHSTCDLYTPICTVNTMAAAYSFAGVSTISGTTDTTTNVAVAGATFGQFSAHGVSSNSNMSGRLAFTKWDTGSVNGATTLASMTGSRNPLKYYEFTVTPKYAYSMTLTGITFSAGRDSIGARSFSVRSSADGYATDLAASITPANPNLTATANNFFYVNDTNLLQAGCKITLSGANFTNSYLPITFRIYGWNAEDTLGTFEVDNLAVTGTNGAMENTQNYMEYSYCSKMFTQGQRTRLRNCLESSVSGRSNLWSYANLVATGVEPSMPVVNCKPHPEFFANRTRLCAGGTVTFTKNVLYGTETGRTWTFYGGSPATSTAAAPVVTYSTPGLYKVTLSATNTAGTDSVVKVAYIHVDPSGGMYSGAGFSEGFESISYPDFFWVYTVNNMDGNPYTWDLTSSTGYNSSHSVVMNGYKNYVADVDELTTPEFNMFGMSGVTLTFRNAGASHAGAGIDLTEALKIYVSTDCGLTWNLRSTISGSTLCNNGYQPGYFIPNSPSQWVLRTVTVPSIYCTSNTSFKFVYTAGVESNNIYIDDININGTVGINDPNVGDAYLNIYPNPTNDESTIAYHLTSKATTKIEIVDVLGKKIYETNGTEQSEGDYTIQVSKQGQNLKNGIYFVKLSIDHASITKKLIITQ